MEVRWWFGSGGRGLTYEGSDLSSRSLEGWQRGQNRQRLQSRKGHDLLEDQAVRLPAAGGAACVEGEHAALWDGALFSVPVTGHFLVPGPVPQHILGLAS